MSLLLKSLFAFSLMLSLVSCNKSEAPAETKGMGAMKVLATDAPFSFEEVDSAVISVNKIYVHSSKGGSTLVSEKVASLDLLKLRNGLTETLSDIQLPVGSYERISLIVTEAFVTLKNGDHFPLKIPSGAQSGLKINISPAITVSEGLSTELLLDFDLNRSFVPQSSGSKITGFIFKPVVRAVAMAESGTLSGEVVNYDTGIPDALITVKKGEEIIATTYTDPDGTFKILGILPGTYDVSAEKDGFQTLKINAVPVTKENEVTTHFLLSPIENEEFF